VKEGEPEKDLPQILTDMSGIGNRPVQNPLVFSGQALYNLGIRAQKGRPMPLPLLATKLYIPPPRPQLMPRPHLIRRLNEALQPGRKLTLIAAPAGFGKTTLLSEWIYNLRLTIDDLQLDTAKESQIVDPKSKIVNQVAWVSLDDSDNDPIRFWNYVVTALDRLHPERLTEAQRLLHAPQTPLETALTALVNVLAEAPRPFVLVLDDYHVIQAQAIHRSLTFLLDHMPPDMHLIMTSRLDPPLPLHRLRVRGHLAELRQRDIRFSLTEMVTFFNQVMGLNLSPEDIIALENRTEGWAAGLQLAAISMQGRGDAADFVRAFTGSHRFVIDYLTEEVLLRQPEHIQTFLLKTSVLKRLSAPLCEAVLHPNGVSSQEILHYLDEANLFLMPLDNERRWFRYHHLFADFLKTYLRQRAAPAEIAGLHRQASRWYAANGTVTEAVRHALAAEDTAEVARLIEQAAITTLINGQVTTVMDWLSRIPEKTILDSPRLSLTQAWTLVLVNRWQQVERLVQAAEKILADSRDSPDPTTRSLWGEIAALRAMLAGVQGHTAQAIELCLQALDRLPPGNPMVRSLITFNLGVGYERMGQLDKAGQTLEQARTLARHSHNLLTAMLATNNMARIQEELGQLPQAAALYRQALQMVTEKTGQGPRPLPIAKWVYIGLAEVLREQNKLEEAKKYLTFGLEIEPALDILGSGTPIAHLILARILQAQGDQAGAWTAIQQAEQTVQPNTPVTLWITAIKARLAVQQGRLNEAVSWANTANLPLETGFEYARYPGEYAALARVFIVQKKVPDALTLLTRMQTAAEQAGRQGRLVEILMLRALALQAQGQADQAIPPLLRALVLGETGGYVRTFADEGLPIAKLLYLTMARKVAPNPAYVEQLVAALPDDKTLPLPETVQTLIEPLSERELEVLALVAAGMSNQAVADRLVISEGTVKKHLHNIFGKLTAHSRTQAIKRAAELNLL
jgi:LuxR family maltose regulon positive regulatory protein